MASPPPFRRPALVGLREATPLLRPGASQSESATGRVQRRDLGARGFRWTETYVPHKLTDPDVRAWLEELSRWWATGQAFTIVHPMHLTREGLGSGTPVINGAGQTGTQLSTRTWGGSNPVLRQGDLVTWAGSRKVRQLAADASAAGGIATLTLDPPILAGESPADGQALIYAAVPIRALLAAAPPLPAYGAAWVASSFTLAFREDV